MNALEYRGLISPSHWRMMSEQDYLNSILARELVGVGLASPALLLPGTIELVLRQWAGAYLLSVTPSGSYAKGTANRSDTDLDLFISLSPDTPDTLSNVHNTLINALKAAGYQPRLQNVSIGVTVHGHSVDLVPGKRQNWFYNDHSLYKRRGDTWTKTDVSKHIETVKGSYRQSEIRIIKLWRTQKRLEFPSLYVELAVIKALELNYLTPLPDNIRTIFAYLRDNILTARFVDPANNNNVISDDLTIAEKKAIRTAALAALSEPYWRDIVL
jgi:hypothetical protein